jgi:toxin-antitoxin system PIN domain toxin
LDVNVLVALAWPNHVHHDAARGWFRATGQTAWATTPVTEAGFVRVSSNATMLANAVTPADALGLLARMRRRPGHVFLADDIEMVVSDVVAPERVVTHRLVTDAHLLAVAHRHGARLATFDRALASLGPRAAVTVIPATAG